MTMTTREAAAYDRWLTTDPRVERLILDDDECICEDAYDGCAQENCPACRLLDIPGTDSCPAFTDAP